MVLIFTACRKQQANSSLPPPKATCCRLIPSLSARGLGTGDAERRSLRLRCKIKRGETSLTACHCQPSSGAPRAGKNSTHLSQFIQKTLAASSSVTPWPRLPGHIPEGPSGEQSYISAAAEPEMPLQDFSLHTRLRDPSIHPAGCG